MRILLHDYSGHPFQVELAQSLAARGHVVEHIHCSSYVSGKGRLTWQQGDPSTLSFSEVPLAQEFAKYHVVKRTAQELHYALRFIRHARRRPWDVVVMCNTPLIAHWLIALWLRRTGRRTVFWHQDVYSQALGHALVERFGAIGRGLTLVVDRMERYIAVTAAEVVIIASTFLAVHLRWGTEVDRLTIQPNWAPIGDLPERPRDNSWARRHNLVGRPVILYSGTLGIKHDVTTFGRLRKELVEVVPDVAMVVVSEGDAADLLRATEPDMTVLPFQPFADLPDVLASADVLMTILEFDASDYSVPSKTLSYLCAGRPVLALMPASNPAYQIVSDAGGLPFDLHDVDLRRVAEAVASVLKDTEAGMRRGDEARAYAEKTFDIEAITDVFEALLSRALDRRRVSDDLD